AWRVRRAPPAAAGLDAIGPQPGAPARLRRPGRTNRGGHRPVNTTMSLLTRVLLVLVLELGAGTATAATTSNRSSVGLTGNYLAGSQALFDLHTEEAAAFMRQALIDGWDNPYVVERGFVAYAANGDIEDAARTAQRLLELDPNNDLARLVIATEAVKRR